MKKGKKVERGLIIFFIYSTLFDHPNQINSEGIDLFCCLIKK